MVLYFIAFLVGLAAFLVQVVLHIRCIRRGRPSGRFDHVSARVKHVLRAAFGQHRVRERWWGRAHVVIFYAFLIFLLGTFELLVTSVDGSWRLSHWIGLNASGVLHLIQTYFAWLTLAAVSVVLLRRIFKKKEVRSSFDAWLILALIEGLMASHIALMCARISLGEEPGWMHSLLPLCWNLGQNWDRLNAMLVSDLMTGAHLIIIAVFLVWIPRGKHLHILFAFPNLFGQYRLYDDSGKPFYGCDTPDLSAYEKSLEMAIEQEVPEEEWPVIGAVKVKDLPRQFLLNGLTCTQCQRCTNVCPMIAVNHRDCIGPMDSMIRLRQLCQKPDCDLVGSRDALNTSEELWSCTQCGACDRACPVGNSHTQRIVEMRRGLVTRESYPSKLNAVFSHLERSGNPWGYAKSERTAWMHDVAQRSENTELPRILIFAGCMSSYNPVAQKTLIAAVNWLIAQGFDVKLLEKEICCGEPLRKLGKEDEFQTVMASNLAEIAKIPHDVILTVCPHCAHVLRNEYDGAESRIKAMHFLEFVADLFDAGRLEISKTNESVLNRVVHVPCGLGKTPETPLRLLKLFRRLGLSVIDDDVSQAHCCGAGGGQFFMENGREIARLRVKELTARHVDEIATACPFCMQMIGDEIVSMNAQEDTKDNLIPMVNVVEICTDCTRCVHVGIKKDKN